MSKIANTSKGSRMRSMVQDSMPMRFSRQVTPADEIVEAAEREKCDLIAMATHGHRFIGDVIRGSVANEVRHKSLVPVLMVRGNPPPKEQKDK